MPNGNTDSGIKTHPLPAGWRWVRLGEVLRRVKDEVLVDDSEFYSRLTIRMNGKGIVLRDHVHGLEIGTKRQFLTRSGQLVLSKIDARNGAFGILPGVCDQPVFDNCLDNSTPESTENDPRLTALIDRWDTLPEKIKAAVMLMVGLD
jgi:hypothetical protein